MIQDEFTNLPVSRQRKYQLRKQRDARCQKCGAPAIRARDGSTTTLCLKHHIAHREYCRKIKGCRRRNLGAISYFNPTPYQTA